MRRHVRELCEDKGEYIGMREGAQPCRVVPARAAGRGGVAPHVLRHGAL